MLLRLSKRSLIKRILVVSMTNIGDAVLTCPAIDILRQDFPQAQIDVVVGKKAVSLFADNPYVGIKVFDKQAPLREKYAWFLDLYRMKYDVVVDLRHTLLPLLLWPKYATPFWGGNFFKGHKRDRHLNRLRQVYDYNAPAKTRYAIVTTKEDEDFFAKEVGPSLQGRSFVVIACGAADSAKRWHAKGFAAIADHLSGTHKVVFVGDTQDALLIEEIQRMMKTSAVSLAGKINLRQLAFVLKKSSWALTHDSGVLHLACYFNVPVIALWGPTDINRYAPWSNRSVIIRRNEKCVRCRDPKSPLPHNCMSFIEVEDVLNAIKKIQL